MKETEERGEPVYEQMNLFPSMAEQVGNISIDRADEVFSLAASNPITDEMIDLARKEIVVSKDAKKEARINEKSETKKIIPENKVHKSYNPDDEIPCKSVTPWKLTAVGVDKHTIYHWEYFGDIEYLKYRDLQALRRTEYITKPNILIMDADLRSQWGRELGDTY